MLQFMYARNLVSPTKVEIYAFRERASPGFSSETVHKYWIVSQNKDTSDENRDRFVSELRTLLGTSDCIFLRIVGNLTFGFIPRSPYQPKSSFLERTIFVPLTLSKSLWNHSFKSTITWPLGCNYGTIACYGEIVSERAPQNCLFGVHPAVVGKLTSLFSLCSGETEKV